MQTLKSIKHALQLSKTQLTAQNLLRGTIRTANGYENFKLSTELKEELTKSIVLVLGGREKTKEQVYNVVKFRKPQHWGLSRIIISFRKDAKDKRKKIVSVSYCAGQDEITELNQIRTELKKM